MKYVETGIVFREIPGETTLAINISGCPVRCEGCHSPWLWKDHGKSLTRERLFALIADNPGITCVALMGGDGEPEAVAALLLAVKDRYGDSIKTCWYSGGSLEEARRYVGPYALDYLKVGPFIKALGPLDSPATNQRMYKIRKNTDARGVERVEYVDITSYFWPEKDIV